jgi:large subunit ribosomal protein L10
MTDTMPSETARAPRPEKIAVVDEVKTRLQGSSAALLTEYRGLKVSELATLRHRPHLGRRRPEDLQEHPRPLRGGETSASSSTRRCSSDPTAIAFVDGDAAAVAKACATTRGPTRP